MDLLTTAQGRSIAYDFLPGAGPVVVFLGGYRSDMTGTKAVALRDWAARSGRAFLRFDYSGHGQSSGRFRDLGISDWLADARAVIAAQVPGQMVLVGSSMGGWIGLLLARSMPGRITAFVGIAAAPDFTEDLMLANFSPDQKIALQEAGFIEEPSPYSDEPNIITAAFLADGAQNLVLRAPLSLPFPTRLLHGSADEEVPVSVALRLLDHADCPDARLVLVKGADHRFSTPDCLHLLTKTIEELSSHG